MVTPSFLAEFTILDFEGNLLYWNLSVQFGRSLADIEA
jgi:hypothetical protein